MECFSATHSSLPPSQFRAYEHMCIHVSCKQPGFSGSITEEWKQPAAKPYQSQTQFQVRRVLGQRALLWRKLSNTAIRDQVISVSKVNNKPGHGRLTRSHATLPDKSAPSQVTQAKWLIPDCCRTMLLCPVKICHLYWFNKTPIGQ